MSILAAGDLLDDYMLQPLISEFMSVQHMTVRLADGEQRRSTLTTLSSVFASFSEYGHFV